MEGKGKIENRFAESEIALIHRGGGLVIGRMGGQKNTNRNARNGGIRDSLSLNEESKGGMSMLVKSVVGEIEEEWGVGWGRAL